MAKKKCDHNPCTCRVSSDEKYCSPHCEAAKGKAEVSCQCEHEDCGGKAV